MSETLPWELGILHSSVINFRDDFVTSDILSRNYKTMFQPYMHSV